MDTTSYHAALPYPPIQAGGKNSRYARIMLDNLGGIVSEMSAVNSYFYNYLITSENPEVSRTFHQISIVEMHHMEIFAILALQLGADPRLWTRKQNKMVYWSPSYNTYPKPIRELLSNSLHQEQAAIVKYQHQAHIINNENIVENLKRIIMDEQLHVTRFKSLLAHLK